MKFLIVTIISLLSITAFSQQSHFLVSGKVINADTKAPMPGASVFAHNTTVGTAADSDGNFLLTLPEGGHELVVTFTGYTTETKRVSSSDVSGSPIIFELRPKEKELAEVAVVATNEVKDGWEKYGDFFLSQFIGKTTNSAHCSIKNPQALKFYFSKKRNRLKVLASEPLLIENNSLGYNIRYTLDSFAHSYSTQVSVYTGYPLYEEMTSTDSVQKSQWDGARVKAYYGSILHFMRSLYDQELNEEGFEIQFVVKFKDIDTSLKLKNFYTAIHYQMDDSLNIVEISPNQRDVGVIYRPEKPAPGFQQENPQEPKSFQFSVLSFAPGESINIEKNGYYFQQNDLTISAYWTWDKIADQLPYDYQLPL